MKYIVDQMPHHSQSVSDIKLPHHCIRCKRRNRPHHINRKDTGRSISSISSVTESTKQLKGTISELN